MDAVPLIVGMLPFAFAAGLNLYATVAIVGLCAHFGLFALPAQFQGFDHPWVIGLALVLYAVEFVADKVPWVDTMWDVVHTFIRPLGGVVVGLAAVGQAPPAVQVAAALLGGSVAMTSHLAKAGTRTMVNASPEPLSNGIVSVAEDLLVVGLTWLAVSHPFIAATVSIVLLVAILAAASLIVGALRRRFARVRVSS